MKEMNPSQTYNGASSLPVGCDFRRYEKRVGRGVVCAAAWRRVALGAGEPLAADAVSRWLRCASAFQRLSRS